MGKPRECLRRGTSPMMRQRSKREHRAHPESHFSAGWLMRVDRGGWAGRVDLTHSNQSSGRCPWLLFSTFTSDQVSSPFMALFRVSPELVHSWPFTIPTIIFIWVPAFPYWEDFLLLSLPLTQALPSILYSATRISFTLCDPHNVTSEPRPPSISIGLTCHKGHLWLRKSTISFSNLNSSHFSPCSLYFNINKLTSRLPHCLLPSGLYICWYLCLECSLPHHPPT